MRPLAVIVLILTLGLLLGPPWAADASRPTITPASPEGWYLSDFQSQVARDAVAVPPPPTVPPLVSIQGADGFWRLGKDQSGVWWFVSPDNELEFLNAVTTVQPYQKARDADGAMFVSRDYLDPETGEPNLARWAKLTADRVLQAGFKALGSWCHPEFHNLDIPATRDLNVWMWIPPDNRRLYDPNWESIAEQAIKQQVEPLKDNRQLIGYFIDNELDWGDTGSGPGPHFDYLPNDDPSRWVVLETARQIWPTVEAFNLDWQTQLASLDELGGWQTLPRNPARAYHRLAEAFRERLAGDYFRITTGLIRKYDPNHLILGVRFRGYAPPEVVRASKGYTDAQSINYYVSDARLDLAMFRMMHEESGQPVMVTEYSFHSLDGRSGNRNTVGFAAQVPDQQARAEGYRLMTSRLARVPYIVGADWFQWMDEPPSGRTLDGEDVNFGIVDVDDEPYPDLVQAIQETTPILNGMHAASYSDPQRDVWRDSFAAKPVMRIPYFKRPPTLNGQLADWPAQSKLEPIQLSQTVGLDRSKLRIPNVKLGWTDAGLLLGFEVFDNDIYGAPADGWWWTRDCVEFWISTRPVASDQTEYDVYSHQFFFVPVVFPGKDGRSGVVGQWKRAGDALEQSLVPHPKVTTAVRVLPDRYVVEMLIPSTALNGFDPASQPAIAFNIYIRNFQQATEYFWSAPKEVMTQHRPNTWGMAYLEPPTSPEGSAAVATPAQPQARSD